jgi:membrane-bound metal-dependent hydrolase YbcI (DUF457 family)
MRRAGAFASLTTIAVADYVIYRRRPRWLVLGLFDHPAHVATAGLVLLNLRRRSPAWSAGFLVGSVLPDLDHVPLALRAQDPSPHDPRPRSHCLLAVAPVGLLAAAGGAPVAGAAAGMLAHFLRDLGVGTGVPLLWPASGRSLALPYAAYAGTCLVLAGRATLKAGL